MSHPLLSVMLQIRRWTQVTSRPFNSPASCRQLKTGHRSRLQYFLFVVLNLVTEHRMGQTTRAVGASVCHDDGVDSYHGAGSCRFWMRLSAAAAMVLRLSTVESISGTLSSSSPGKSSSCSSELLFRYLLQGNSKNVETLLKEHMKQVINRKKPRKNVLKRRHLLMHEEVSAPTCVRAVASLPSSALTFSASHQPTWRNDLL